MYHHVYEVSLESAEGVTFGMVAEKLERLHAEDNHYFREQNRLAIEAAGKLPWTRESRQVHVSAMEVLNGPLDRNWCEPVAVPCLHLDAEGAISWDSEAVQCARK